MKDKLYVIDFDRTLGDVSQVMILAEQASQAAGIDFSRIKDEAENASAAGTPYSPLDTILEQGEDRLKVFKKKFVDLGEPDRLVYADGWRYLKRLDETGAEYMILTHAVDEQWQRLKLEAGGLGHIPTIITFNPKKAEIIAGWIDDTGNFTPPVARISPARQLVFVDDRLRAFENLPDNCQGFYLNRRKTVLEGHRLPSGVTEISSFDEIIDKI